MMEVWKPVPGYVGKYEVSDRGRVKSLGRVVVRKDGRTKTIPERVLAPVRHNRGYSQTTLSMGGKARTYLVHVLVAGAFLGPKPVGLECCHNNGDRANNTLGNLRYGSPKENCEDRRLHGTHPIGEGHKNAKLTSADIKKIRVLSKTMSQAKVAGMYGIAQTTVSKITRRVAWPHI
jgi:hypothetical protein